MKIYILLVSCIFICLLPSCGDSLGLDSNVKRTLLSTKDSVKTIPLPTLHKADSTQISVREIYKNGNADSHFTWYRANIPDTSIYIDTANLAPNIKMNFEIFNPYSKDSVNKYNRYDWLYSIKIRVDSFDLEKLANQAKTLTMKADSNVNNSCYVKLVNREGAITNTGALNDCRMTFELNYLQQGYINRKVIHCTLIFNYVPKNSLPSIVLNADFYIYYE